MMPITGPGWSAPEGCSRGGHRRHLSERSKRSTAQFSSREYIHAPFSEWEPRRESCNRSKVPLQSHLWRRHLEQGLVAEAPAARPPAPALHQVRPDGRGFRLCQGVQEPRFRGAEERPRGAHDGFTGLVAGGLRPLWAVVHPHGVAQRRHVPHGRRPWRRWKRAAALCAAQQLAGQHQSREGAAPALADQAEVRPQDFLGRPDDPHRQRGPRDDGIQDLRLCRRSRGRMGAGS